MKDTQALIAAALDFLGINRLVLGIHDQSFPAEPGEDTGRGTPYSEGAANFISFIKDLGFTGIQFGPQGITGRTDPSPYNGTIFSRNTLSLSPRALARIPEARPFLTMDIAKQCGCGDAGLYVDYERAWRSTDLLLDSAIAFYNVAESHIRKSVEAFVSACRSSAVPWFDRACRFESLAQEYGTDDWTTWPKNTTDVCKEYPVTRFILGQYLLSLQHRELRQRARESGLMLYTDMQTGYSHRDRWMWGELFLSGYLLGAPPSRTNPEGQPWGYPVLNPHFLKGPVRNLMKARVERLLEDFDGIRIDHPHGLVCPWVYKSDDPDPFHAVQNGARLYSSPDRADHPRLQEFSIVRPDQIADKNVEPMFGDNHVQCLSVAQINQYATVLDIILDSTRQNRNEVLCEVLSTWPAPLKAVMQSRGLGRFCVTQKADVHNPDDVYRGENSTPGDWIMTGNHDTKPLRLIVDEKSNDWRQDRAMLLAARLEPDPGLQEAYAASLVADNNTFCTAMFGELFLGPADNIFVFFPDLFGMREVYNTPGTVGPHNWALRVPPDYKEMYKKRCRSGEAFNVTEALALALHAKFNNVTEGEVRDLVTKLKEIQ